MRTLRSLAGACRLAGTFEILGEHPCLRVPLLHRVRGATCHAALRTYNCIVYSMSKAAGLRDPRPACCATMLGGQPRSARLRPHQGAFCPLPPLMNRSEFKKECKSDRALKPYLPPERVRGERQGARQRSQPSGRRRARATLAEPTGGHRASGGAERVQPARVCIRHEREEQPKGGAGPQGDQAEGGVRQHVRQGHGRIYRYREKRDERPRGLQMQWGCRRAPSSCGAHTRSDRAM